MNWKKVLILAIIIYVAQAFLGTIAGVIFALVYTGIIQL